MNGRVFRRSERMVLALLVSAIACVLISLALGAVAALYYVPGFSAPLQRMGVSLVQLRPMHTTFASAWIFLGAVTVVHHYLFTEFGEPTAGDRVRFKVQMVLWGLAGLGALVTLPMGITSGREYLGFHPIFSLMIAVGWLLFAITFFKKVARGFWGRPVYVYMWATGVLYFLYTFAEGHAYLLPFVHDYPVADLQIQWKSCGTLVASFNQMVYGCLIFLGERLSGDKRLAQSRLSFSLFGVGLLNSVTNYAHHTYHLPQSHVVKWIAFGVSMLEILILVGVFKEVARLLRRGRHPSYRFCTTVQFIELSQCWNVMLLFLAILISIPPLNSLIHGTHVVMAHAMGSEIAIDSYILFAGFAYLLRQIFPKREVTEHIVSCAAMRGTIARLNLSLIGVFACLMISGLTVGVTRYLDQPKPAVLELFPYLFASFGFLVALSLIQMFVHWLPLLRAPDWHKLWAEDRATVES